ncbi:EAL domain-containing protein [Tumebacillus sp. DT12]|uniref:EAL domain-containing protein n=1 Tax=Tumebacillus lacus TaxID=2995335 RepID=A0ABT3WXB8_9BACL|nr:EAL domain-containing protein [Tumebacillus lacus]MCX7569310.1 EAL domain-containing protein [Tumebacillus lacus]
MLRRLRDYRLLFLSAVLGSVAVFQIYLASLASLSSPFSIFGPDTDLYWLIESVLTFLAVRFVISILDERMQFAKKLEEKEQYYKSLFEHNPDAVYTLNLEGAIIHTNAASVKVTGYGPEETHGLPVNDLIPPDERFRAQENFFKALQGEPQNYELTARHRDGHSVELAVTNVPILVNGEVQGVYAIAKDITVHRTVEKRLRHMAFYDTTTNLPNRILFEDQLGRELSRARQNNRTLAVFSLDIDRFKYVNDTLGHTMGDLLLQSVTERLRECAREGDTVARVGGDEFTLILSDLDDPADAVVLAEQVLAAFAQPFMLDEIELFVTASVGISIGPNDGHHVIDLIKNADTAMYRAKELGRNNYQLYNPQMAAPTVQSLSLMSDLRKALDKGEFVVYYQPQIRVPTGELIGVEALLRWNHPTRGMISPAQFIPLAEETGLIIPIGEWVLRTACAQVKAWAEDGYPEMRVAVNLSARQFMRDDLVDVVERALRDTGLKPHLLDLEITESMTMHNVDRAIQILHGLKNLGVMISLDDFGTGYSSLSYLKHFPIHMLKIDQSFVRDITVDPDDAAIANSIIALAHALNLKVIAEGVETEEQLGYLLEQGCQEMQGYLFSPPLPVDRLENLIRFVEKQEEERA